MDPLLPDTIRCRLPYLLAKAHQRQLTLFEQHTAEFAISGREYATLLVVQARSAPWQSDIAQLLALDRTTVTHIVDQLERRGWLARQRDPADRRAHVITLTGTGETALARIRPVVEAANTELLAPLAEAERGQLRDLLARLIAP